MPERVRQQVFDRHPVVDEREIRAEDRPCRRGKLQRAVFDQAHHRECGQALGATRDAEPRVDRVRDPVSAIGQPVRSRELDPARAVDTHDAGEPRPLGLSVDRLLQWQHRLGSHDV
jgi:hypothetical protein